LSRKRLFVIALLTSAITAGTCYATERAANMYKTHKLALNSVMVSCNDEREPVVSKLTGPFVIISCQTK